MSKQKPGFTLIEVLLALALFAVLGTVLLRIFSSAQGTTTTVNATALLESQLANAEARLTGLAQSETFAGLLYGDGGSLGLLFAGPGVHPKPSTTFATDTELAFEVLPAPPPAQAGLIDNGTRTRFLMPEVKRAGDRIEVGCASGVPWTPNVVYHPVSTLEVGLGSALNARYGTDSFDAKTLYLRTNEDPWEPLLGNVESLGISYVYRDPAGNAVRSFPEEGDAPWTRNEDKGDTKRTLLPKLAVLDPEPLYLTEAVLRIRLKAGDVERTAEILLPFNRPERRVVRVNACDKGRGSYGDLYLRVSGLPAQLQDTKPIHIGGPDANVTGDYSKSKGFRDILSGDYTITARAVRYTDGQGVTHVYAPRIDPDVPLKLADPASWTVRVTSWQPKVVRVVYEEQPGVLTMVKRVIFVSIPFSWVVPGNGDGGVTGPSGRPAFWYSGGPHLQGSPDLLAPACDDGYPCTPDGIGWMTGDPWPVWGGQDSAYARPGTYRPTPNSLFSISWLAKWGWLPAFPVPIVYAGGCFNTQYLAGYTLNVESGKHSKLYVDYLCVPTF